MVQHSSPIYAIDKHCFPLQKTTCDPVMSAAEGLWLRVSKIPSRPYCSPEHITGTYHIVLFSVQSGLECIKERLLQETVERYGVSKEFVKAEADTMREVLAELRRR